MITKEQIESKAKVLGAFLSFSDNSSCVNVIMPLTKQQEKEGLSHGDLIATPNYNTLQQNFDLVYNFMVEWQQKWELKNDVKKKEIEEFVRTKLGTDDLWAKKALLLIYGLQTADEQSSGHTINNNSVGFTGCDSEYLSSLARQLREHANEVKRQNSELTEIEVLKKAWLSKKQMCVLKKTMKKYWKQVVVASDEMKLLKAVKAARSVQQMILTIE
jgi:hypothetical protein